MSASPELSSGTTPAVSDTRAPQWRKALLWTVTGLGIALLVAAVGLRLHGGNSFIVESPSMGEAAPVGTLVVTAPVTDQALRVGQIISFHPPTERDATYTHRIAAIDSAGLISTRGDINGAVDGWRLQRSDVIGQVIGILPGIGWLIKGLPVLLGGGALVWWLSGLVRRRDLLMGLRFTGFALVITATLAWLRPLFGATALQVTSSDHAARALVVSTGLLPVKVSAINGTHTDLVAGQVGTVAAHLPAAGHYSFDVALNLPWWGWVAVAAVCIAPTVASVLLARRPAHTEP